MREQQAIAVTLKSDAKAAQAYRPQIERGLDDNPREAAKARVILRDLLGQIQMCPEPDGSLWAQYHTRPAALIKRAAGASVELSGSGGGLSELYADRPRPVPAGRVMAAITESGRSDARTWAESKGRLRPQA